MAASTARFRLSLLALALAARCEAWVVFDAARLEKAVPDGQLAKNTSDVLTTGETMRLILSDGFPGSFRWSAQPAIRYAIAPDFCEAMKGTMIEEDGWLKDIWPIMPPVNWTACDRLHQIVRQSFDTWAENNPSLHFVDVTDRCTVEQAWVPISPLHCATSPECVALYAENGLAGAGSSMVDDANDPLKCSSKTCFDCDRADVLVGAFIQEGRQLADEGSRMRVVKRELSDQPPLGMNGVPQPGGMLTGATLQVLVDSQVFVDWTDGAYDGDGENFTQVAHCWRLDADLCSHYIEWGQARVNTISTALFGTLFAICVCSCICGCLICLQKLVTNLLAGWDLDQDGKVEIHEIMYVLDEFCGEICFECRCPNLHQQKMSKLEGALGVFETITQMNAVLMLVVVGCCLLLPMAYGTEVAPCWTCADFRAALTHEVGHLLALDNADVWSSNITFTHDTERSPYPPYESALLDCLHPETGVVLGTPPDGNASIMRKFFLTAGDQPEPRRCLSTDDLAALNYLYPSCSGTMLILPACGARASGRAPIMRLLQNFITVFCIPATIIVGLKLFSIFLLGVQGAFAKFKLARGARAVVQESERQSKLKKRFLRKKGDATEVEKNLAAAKAKRAKREAKALRRGRTGADLLRLGVGRKKLQAPEEAPAAAPAPAPEAATPVVAYVSPARRALEEEMKRAAERAEAKASELSKDSTKAEIHANPKAYEKEKRAKEMAAKAAELKKLASSSADHAAPPKKPGLATEDEGRVYLQKGGKGKGKAPEGSVAADLGY